MTSTQMFQSYKRTTCRICGSEALEEYLDLGDQPPSNSFISEDQIPGEQVFPLKVDLCTCCGMSQLQDVVSATDIFDDYHYLASTSKALCRHYQELVEAAIERLKPADNALVVDVGCNDGILLKGYPKDRFRILGVEPSSAGDYARKEGFDVDQAFFNQETGSRLSKSHGKASIITATNVFAHVDDIHSFARGVEAFLANDGMFITEFPYLGDMLEHCYFDTIYHEHLSYLALAPLVTLFKDCGLRAVRVERTEIGASGPALRLFVALESSSHPTDESISDLLAEEQSWGVARRERYQAFAARVAEVKQELLKTITQLNAAGHKVGAYSAPAKGNTLLNYLKLEKDQIQLVSENNELKIGKLTPGTHIPIISDPEFIEAGITHALLLSWNYVDFFVKNTDFIKQGGKFIVPLPQPVIRP